MDLVWYVAAFVLWGALGLGASRQSLVGRWCWGWRIGLSLSLPILLLTIWKWVESEDYTTWTLYGREDGRSFVCDSSHGHAYIAYGGQTDWDVEDPHPRGWRFNRTCPAEELSLVRPSAGSLLERLGVGGSVYQDRGHDVWEVMFPYWLVAFSASMVPVMWMRSWWRHRRASRRGFEVQRSSDG